MSNPLFSIIVPVYNVQDYLPECLSSIAKQLTLFPDDIEVLLIDDGSTDKSGYICDKFKQEVSANIRVFHRRNAGLFQTRRFGLKEAQGTYILNCDSDDLLELHAIKTLKQEIDKYNEPDLLLFNYSSLKEGRKKIITKNLFTYENDVEVSKEDVIRKFISTNTITSMWCKAYKKECADPNKTYDFIDKVNTAEDSIQTVTIVDNAKKIVYINNPLYSYRAGSGMTNSFDKDYLDHFSLFFNELKTCPNFYKVENFNKLFVTKVFQITGRAITQCRYNSWESRKSFINYLSKIRNNFYVDQNISKIFYVRKRIKFSYFIFLALLKRRLYIIIILLLTSKNVLNRNKR